jgi:hypothetical protein
MFLARTQELRLLHSRLLWYWTEAPRVAICLAKLRRGTRRARLQVSNGGLHVPKRTFTAAEVVIRKPEAAVRVSSFIVLLPAIDLCP